MDQLRQIFGVKVVDIDATVAENVAGHGARHFDAATQVKRGKLAMVPTVVDGLLAERRIERVLPIGSQDAKYRFVRVINRLGCAHAWYRSSTS